MVYSDKVVDILQYVQEHPLHVKGEKMFYQPTNRLDSRRLPDVIETLAPEDVIVEQAPTEARINKAPLTKKQMHMAEVTTAMLYFACGGMDEAHNMVLPYSWPSESPISGPPVLNSPAAQESEYCHALIHRKEGEYVGELGMVGWENCKFWFSRTGTHFLYPEVKTQVVEIAKLYQDKSENVVQFLNRIKNNPWDPDVLTALCAATVSHNDDKHMMEFCNKATNMEWKLLLDTCNSVVNPI